MGEGACLTLGPVAQGSMGRLVSTAPWSLDSDLPAWAAEYRNKSLGSDMCPWLQRQGKASRQRGGNMTSSSKRVGNRICVARWALQRKTWFQCEGAFGGEGFPKSGL